MPTTGTAAPASKRATASVATEWEHIARELSGVTRH